MSLWRKAILDRPGWIFDLDGTLTIAAHDFDAIRSMLELPQGAPILEALDALPVEIAAPKRLELEIFEAELAGRSLAAEGVENFLQGLSARHAQAGQRGIVTRNSKSNAHISLSAAGLAQHFEAPYVLGRDEAPPKPDPGALQILLKAWSLAPQQAVMVGDFRYDLEAGRAAGVATVHVDVGLRQDFGALADIRVSSFAELCREFD